MNTSEDAPHPLRFVAARGLWIVSLMCPATGQALAGVEVDPTTGSTISAGAEGGARLTAVAELGFVTTMSHTIQFSNAGTEIDYVDDAGQGVLFSAYRLSVELGLDEAHRIILLYQPLELTSRELLARDLTIDELTFPAGTPTEFRYSFPFWRLSYLYDVLDAPEYEIAFGGSLQIRDATIEFASIDGTLFRANRGVGPVPILKFRARSPLSDALWIGTEIDGFYAPVSVLNGSDNEITGAIIDASARIGLSLTDEVESFVNVRWLGGGAVGTSDDDGPGDGYVKNWLHFLFVTLGFSLSAG